MKCSRCQYENPLGSNFCLGCGARLGAACRWCGNDLPAGSRFCNKCGAPVSADSGGQVRFAPPESYTPKHLAERILTSKSALEGERKQVTVLFADLKGSMELLADRDPEEARKILDPVLELMMEAVHRYEGTVNQVMGDGIMALFGAPITHEDHAVRACYAALRMQELVKGHAEDARRAHGVNVQVRIGLNSGEVVVRAIGSDLHMDYTAVGQTTHLAARMEQFASPGSILLTRTTRELVEGFVAVKSLGPVPVKGLEVPTEVYELTGAGPQRSRFHAAAARGLTHFVGRESELNELHHALRRAADDHGQVVAIVGEPGVGKSRLVWELAHSRRVDGWLVLQTGSVSYGKATSYLPVVDLLKRYFAIEERDVPRTVREKVAGRLLTLDRAQVSSLPAFLSLIDVPTEDPKWPKLDPPERRRRTLDAVKRLLWRETQMQPLLVVVEDLHWIDSETQALLDELVESLPAARLLLLVNYRPGYQHPWMSRTYYTQLRLDPLPPASAEQILGALLGPDGGLAPLTQVLIARTEGNPFFLEESVRALVETGVLVGDRGAYRLTRPLPTIQVPATVQAVLAARIDRLPPEDKVLLQTASVVGKDVPLALLQAIAELAEDELYAALGRLRAAEFLYEARIFPDLEYTFKHALTHEVAYGSLLQKRRRELHSQILSAIEEIYVGRLDEQIERLAHHALRGGASDKAARYLHEAGAKAMARSANREAVIYLEQALSVLEREPTTHEMQTEAVDVCLKLRNSLLPLGELDRGLGYLRRAERLVTAIGDPRQTGQVLSLMSHHLWSAGESRDALAFAHRTRAIAEELEDVPLRVAGHYFVGGTSHATGDYRQAEDSLRAVIQLLDGPLSRERCGLPGFPAATTRGWLAWTLGERGAFDEGMDCGQEGIHLADTLDHPYSLSMACWCLASLCLIRGQVDMATHLLERGRSAAVESRFWYPLFNGPLGYARALSGRIDEGLSLLHEALTVGQAMKLGVYEAVRLVQLGEVYLFADRPDEALEPARSALSLARQRGERGHEAWALLLLGETASHHHSSDAATAEAHYGEALALASELGMRPLVAHCHLGLGKLYQRKGRRTEAEGHFATETAMYREMDMRFWLEKAELEQKA